MSTERYMQIRCDSCGEACESVDCTELTESELRRDLKKRFGWLSWRTEVPRGHQDICPACKASPKGGR